MKSLSLFLAQRYLFKTAYEDNIGVMVYISFFSIFIGSFALALVTAVMNGFEIVTHQKMQGIHAQVIIRGHGDPLDTQQLSQVLEQEFSSVDHFSPTSTRHCIIRSKHEDPQSTIAVVKGIDPNNEHHVTNFDKKIIRSNNRPIQKNVLQEFLTDDALFIGQQMAQTLGIKPGDTVELLFPQEEKASRKKIPFESTNATVVGLFKTGIEEFDSSMVISSLSFFDEMFPDVGVEQVNVKLSPDFNEQETIAALKKRLPLEIYSWKELYPALVSALKLEKYVAFLILALITLVASMNVISLLFMQITQKRSDIAILKALGYSYTTVRNVFIAIGMLITVTATTCGLACAWGASWLLEHYPFIELPDVYYVSHLPAKMEWSIVATVFIVITVIGLLATWIPSRGIRYMNISQILRFEG